MPLADEDGGTATIASGALAAAVRSDAEQVTGVSRARVRMAGTEHRPHLRLALSLQAGADVRGVWAELDDEVLDRAPSAGDRTAAGCDPLPVGARGRPPGQLIGQRLRTFVVRRKDQRTTRAASAVSGVPMAILAKASQPVESVR